ncbi:hypothetical protein PC9H_004625 [Pleurotus ostreatus]|uniref:AB hydrolase-1 domain-containing protein n=1 Tax=Pleurotus ostreatus TaxID=5322 RepID=A0A8H7DW96_PLEOS|nr:uncharacterized protein PC9H_004625 [Pleurotus ostreatus]KAF7432683.1 hypothetical protein PC9H_004625 [Pleurotus ostreatus]
MDPQKPDSFQHYTARLSTGRSYHYVDQLPKEFDAGLSPTILCIHGFPDLWYGWRYQIGPWVRKGYRVVVPDMLGYGDTDKPFDAKEYSTKQLCSDLAALLDHLKVERAVIVGHDWGSFTAARFAMWYPVRLTALVIISVPYTPPSRTYIPVEEVAARVPNLGYQVYFSRQESTKDIESNLGKFITLMFRPGNAKGPKFTHVGQLKDVLARSDIIVDDAGCFLTPEEFRYYHHEFSKGMNGPLNYYRTAKYRHDEEQEASLAPHLRADLPVLFMWGTKDPTCVNTVISKAHKFVPGLQDFSVEDKGHWMMVEAENVVTEKRQFPFADWLKLLGPEQTRPTIEKVITALKGQGVTHLAVIGYCFGEIRVEFEGTAPHQQLYGEGCTHGFAIKGDLSNPKVKEGKEGSFKAAVL